MPTEFLDDVLQGCPVIQSLDVNDLPAGVHKFWFRSSDNALAHDQHMPVSVFKGSKPGKRIMITASVHGDEYNGVLTAHQVARDLLDRSLAGTVTIIPNINPIGMLNHSRHFFSSDPDCAPANLNRLFPGDHSGNEAQRFVYSIWHKLLKNNADLAIDLHTQTSGVTYPLYIFADFRLQDSLEMARRFNPDVILNDPGDPGILETVWNQNGIPSITVEVGMGRYTQMDLVTRSVEGVHNVLRYFDVLPEESQSVVPCLEGQSIISIRAEKGGFIVPQVELMQVVEKGQLLAIQYGAFGEEICRYTAPKAATVLSHNVESMRAAGSLVVRLIN